MRLQRRVSSSRTVAIPTRVWRATSKGRPATRSASTACQKPSWWISQGSCGGIGREVSARRWCSDRSHLCCNASGECRCPKGLTTRPYDRTWQQQQHHNQCAGDRRGRRPVAIAEEFLPQHSAYQLCLRTAQQLRNHV